MTADFILPRDADLGLRRIANNTGLAAALLPNGALFALSHRVDDKSDPVLVNQVLGRRSPAASAGCCCGSAAAAWSRRSGRRRGCRSGSGKTDSSGPARRRPGASRHAVAGAGVESLAVAGRGREQGPGGGRGLGGAAAGYRPRQPRLPDEQRSLWLAIHRPPRRPASQAGPGGDEPPGPGPGRPDPLGGAWLPGGRGGLRHRCRAELRPRLPRPRRGRRASCPASGCSTRSPARPSLQAPRRWRPAPRRPGASSACSCPTTRRRRRMPTWP